MEKNQRKNIRRTRRRNGIRKRVVGIPEQPRLSVYRSSKHLYAQVIDDLSGRTLAASNTVQTSVNNGCNVEAAKQIGKQIAEKAKATGIAKVTFDRNGFRYHGRVKALANAAREGGLKF